MKKQNLKNKSRTAAKNRRARVVTVTVAILLIAVAGITVLSKQLTSTNASPVQRTTSQAPTYVNVKVAGHDVQINPQTGQIKPMSAEKALEIANELKARLNKSTDGLVQVRHSDGSVSIDLQNRAQNVVLARTNEDGSVESTCVDDPLAAAEFLGIDPKLVGVDVGRRPNGQVPFRTPARNVIQ